MFTSKRVLAAGAVVALLLPLSLAGARDRQTSAAADVPGAARFSAQYDGQGYGPGGGAPDADYGPGSGQPGAGGPGYGGPGGPGYAQGAAGYGPGGGYDQVGPRSRGAGFVSYHGFRIRPIHALASTEGRNEIAGAQSQIAIVERAGLSPSAMRLFRAQPIDFGARSMFTRETVILGGIQGGDSRPVLLHEFMHVYHRSRIPGGFGNPTIQRFYQEALASGRWPQGSYMLSNVQEYFAMTASCFLNGSVARPPYTRDAIQQNQPEYYAYLAQLFGRGG